MMTKLKAIMAISFLIVGCGPSFFQEVDLLTSGYLSVIPFEDRQGLPIIKVMIEGDEFDFLFDSGAISIFSSEVGKEIGFKKEFTSEFGDSQDNKFNIDFGHLNNLQIGDLSYSNIAFGMADFSSINAVSCLEIDGIIGANIMQKSIWKIDYQSNELTVTDNLALLKIADNAQRIKIKTDDKGQAFVDLKIGDSKLKNVEIDLGSRSAFTLTKDYLDNISRDTELRVVSASGYGAAGFTGYGEPSNKLFYIKTNQIEIGQEIFSEQIVEFDEHDDPTIGNAFLKNYDVVIDWFDRKLYLTKINTNKVQLENYGISLIYKDGEPVVGLVFNDENSNIKQIRPGNAIVQINGKNCQNISKAEWCLLLDVINNSQNEVLDITVIREGVELTLKLPLIELL